MFLSKCFYIVIFFVFYEILRRYSLQEHLFYQPTWLYLKIRLQFDISSDGGGISRLIANNSSLNLDSNKIDFSFLHGLYSMGFEKINDCTYRETVKNNFFWKPSNEIFYYSLKDSCYTLNNYFAERGKPREEKEMLEGTMFDKKYKTFPELFNSFEKGLLKDSLHCIVLGLPYSVKIEKSFEEDETNLFL